MPIQTRGPLCWLCQRHWLGQWNPGSAVCISLEPVSLRKSCQLCCALSEIHTGHLVDSPLTWWWANSGWLRQDSPDWWRGVRCPCMFHSWLCCLIFVEGTIKSSQKSSGIFSFPRCDWWYHRRHWLLLGLHLCTNQLGFNLFLVFNLSSSGRWHSWFQQLTVDDQAYPELVAKGSGQVQWCWLMKVCSIHCLAAPPIVLSKPLGPCISVDPLADSKGMVPEHEGLYTVFRDLNNCLELFESAYPCTSSAFLSHQWSFISCSPFRACPLRYLNLSALDLELGVFCHSA